MILTKFQCALIRWESDPKARARGGFWWTLLWWAITFVASILLAPKPELENAKPSGLGDFKFPTATEGRAVPLIWGTVRIDGPNVVWYGDLFQEKIKEKVKTGMFSSESVITGYKYYLGIQFALCRGPLTGTHDGLLEMWVGDDAVYGGAIVTAGNDIAISEPRLFGGNDLGNGGFIGTWKFHGGAANQAVSTYLTAFQLEGGDTPAYRGTCYLAPSSENAYLGNSTSIKPNKFELRRIPDGLSLAAGAEIINSADCNPMNVIYEIMTDSDWGLGYDPAEIDTTNFAAAAATLATEGNGFSFILDSPTEAAEVIRIVEKQIEGVIFFDQTTALWVVKLVRADYTPAALPNINVGNMSKADWSFSRGSWENTTNIIRTQYSDRDDEYKTTFGLAQDTANIRIQGSNVSSTVSYPGCKNADLANVLAWRDLRTLSYPLAKATITVDRTFWDVNPGDVYTFTHATLGIVEMPMRVQRIDYGQLENNKIRLDLVQDVFYSASASGAAPGPTGWTAPEDTLVAFPATEQRAFEAPRALVRRDPTTGGTLTAKLYAMGRQNNNEVKFEIRERNSSGTPSGAYQEAGTVYDFVKIGQLTSALTTKSAYPLATLNITDNPDTETDILAAFTTASSTTELGVELLNLLLIDDEFILVSSAQAGSGTTVDLIDVYRGVLDSVQADHAISSDVFIVTAGAGITVDSVKETNNVDVKLIPMSITDEVLESAATTISFAMDKRNRRPYPPSMLNVGGTDWDTTSVDMQGTGSGFEDYSTTLTIDRRDYRVADGNNELVALVTDGIAFGTGALFDDNDLQHSVEIRHDPAGTDDLILTGEAFLTDGQTYELQLIDIWIGLNGAAPTGDIQVLITANHDDGADTDLVSRQTLDHQFSTINDKSGEFEFGLLSNGETSALYTTTITGVYAFTLTSAFTVGNVEYRVNGGAWTNLITAGGTSGSTASLTATDTLEIQHLSSDSGIKKVITMNAAGAGQDGFAVFEN